MKPKSIRSTSMVGPPHSLWMNRAMNHVVKIGNLQVPLHIKQRHLIKDPDL